MGKPAKDEIKTGSCRQHVAVLRRQFKRRRKWLIFTILLMLLTDLFAFEALRQVSVAAGVDRVDAAIAEVESQLLKGKTPAEFYQSRVKGSNGWKYVRKMRELCDWYKVDHYDTYDAFVDLHDNGQPDDDYYIANPPDQEMLRIWLDRTARLVGLAEQAGACDIVVQVPEAAKDPRRMTSLSERFAPWHVFDARLWAHQFLGNNDAIQREVIVTVALAERQTCPNTLVDSMVTIGERGLAWGLVRDALERNLLKPETLRDLNEYGSHPESYWLNACEGELVWQAWVWKDILSDVDDISWYDWLDSDDAEVWDILEGRGLWMFEPVYELHQYAQFLRYALRHRAALRQGAEPPEPQNVVSGQYAMVGVENDIGQARIDVTRLAVRLRLLEHENGPLAGQREAVGALAGEFPHAEVLWEGSDILVQLAYDELMQSGYNSNDDEKAFSEANPPLRLEPTGS